MRPVLRAIARRARPLPFSSATRRRRPRAARIAHALARILRRSPARASHTMDGATALNSKKRRRTHARHRARSKHFLQDGSDQRFSGGTGYTFDQSGRDSHRERTNHGSLQTHSCCIGERHPIVVARYVMSGRRCLDHDSHFISRKRMDGHRSTGIGLPMERRRFRRARRFDRKRFWRRYVGRQFRLQFGWWLSIGLRLGQRFGMGFRRRLAMGRRNGLRGWFWVWVWLRRRRRRRFR